MKRKITIMFSLLLVIALLLSSTPVMAGGKTMDVIARSNGFPSGQHFNLNIHGRDPATFTGDPGSGGNSIFVAITGNSTIEYLSNKRNINSTELTVLDPLSEAFDDDPAQVYLPYNIVDESDNTTKPAGGYYVFGRILAKPNNGSEGPSKILMYPTFVIAADNSENTTWPMDPDYDQLTLGYISSQGNLYGATAEGFERFTQPETKGKGKSTAKDISQLFYWTGYLSDNMSLDTNSNGYLDIGDVPVTYDTNGTPGIQQDEFDTWLNDLVLAGQADYFEDYWVFDIAEMVIAGQIIENDGAKLLQVRFYPEVTTQFGD